MLKAIVLAFATVAGSLSNPDEARAGQAAPAACHGWQECRQLALEAAERSDFEQFHDLAWRAVQAGPPKDPGLMYLLARAQCLSGRPHDALIMLRRLAESGVPTDADSSEDFRRTRELPGWPEVALLIARVRDAGTSVAKASG